MSVDKKLLHLSLMILLKNPCHSSFLPLVQFAYLAIHQDNGIIKLCQS